jgi:hypothetical protein
MSDLAPRLILPLALLSESKPSPKSGDDGGLSPKPTRDATGVPERPETVVEGVIGVSIDLRPAGARSFHAATMFRTDVSGERGPAADGGRRIGVRGLSYEPLV